MKSNFIVGIFGHFQVYGYTSFECWEGTTLPALPGLSAHHNSHLYLQYFLACLGN